TRTTFAHAEYRAIVESEGECPIVLEYNALYDLSCRIRDRHGEWRWSHVDPHVSDLGLDRTRERSDTQCGGRILSVDQRRRREHRVANVDGPEGDPDGSVARSANFELRGLSGSRELLRERRTGGSERHERDRAGVAKEIHSVAPKLFVAP